MEDFLEIIGVIVLSILLVIGLALIFTLPVMWLWNWLMPYIFGFPTLNFWQSLGLSTLCGILFKSTNIKTKD